MMPPCAFLDIFSGLPGLHPGDLHAGQSTLTCTETTSTWKAVVMAMSLQGPELYYTITYWGHKEVLPDHLDL